MLFHRRKASSSGKEGTMGTRPKRRRSDHRSDGTGEGAGHQRRRVKFVEQLPSPSRGDGEEGGKLPWRKHEGIDRWLEENGMVRSRGERPGGALIIVGPRFAGKTTWARQFGQHVYLSALHCPVAMDVSHDGYVVCDDMTKEYPYAKQVLSCQPVVTMSGEEGRMVQIRWGRPCIWTCDQWDDPRKWGKEMAAFVAQVCTVLDMNECGWSSMYEKDSGSEESEDEEDLEESGEEDLEESGEKGKGEDVAFRAKEGKEARSAEAARSAGRGGEKSLRKE